MILPLSASGPRALRPHRDLSNSLLLNFPREKLSFMDLPPTRPATTIRLPRSVSDILRANSRVDRANAATQPPPSKTSTIAEDDRLSEADSSAPPHSGLSASTSTLGTAETAETELTPPSSALENNAPASQPSDKSSKKKAKQQAAEKRKRRREKDRLAKLAVLAVSSTQTGEKADPVPEEEDDGRAAALAKFRNRSDSTSTSSSVASKPPVTVSVPQSSTSKLLASNPVPVWADDLPDSTPVESHDFATLEAAESPALSPRHKSWTHDDRTGSFQRSRRGSRSSLHSANLSRRSSVQDDRFSRPYSPASSQGGWQEVQTRVSKKPPSQPALRPGNAFVKRSISKEPIWMHDKFEDQRGFDDRSKTRPVGPLSDFAAARSSEALWISRPAFPQLFNEPGSRLIVDDKGRRKMTLRISLRPIYQLAAIPNKRLARERAGVVEFDLQLQVEPSTSSAVPPPLGDDISIVIKLDFKGTPTRVPSAAARARQSREAQESQKAPEQAAVREQTPSISQEPVQAEAPPKVDVAQSAFAQEIALGFQQQPPQEEFSSQEPPIDVLYVSNPAPSSKDTLEAASAHLRSAVMTPSEEQQPSSAHIPSVEQQMAAQDQQHAAQPPPPPEGFFSPEGFPPFPVFHEPFIGMDGFTYYFDPSNGQSVPGPPLPFMPGFNSPMDMPPPASPAPLFAPRRSHKIEIKAPTPESIAELRARPKSFNKHRQTTSTSHRSQPSYPMEEPPPEVFIPGSFEAGGSVYFAPPTAFAPAFSAPPPFFIPNGVPQDPAIVAMGAASSEAHPQATASPTLGSQ